MHKLLLMPFRLNTPYTFVGGIFVELEVEIEISKYHVLRKWGLKTKVPASTKSLAQNQIGMMVM